MDTAQSNLQSKTDDKTVWLAIYDLSDQNWWTAHLGVGIFHSGVEVYGVEWAYGGHEYDVSGIFATDPGDAPGPVTFRERIRIGSTAMTAQEVQDTVNEMGGAFRGNSYHLLQKNCNTFSNELCRRLSGQDAPAWVNRLAGIASCVHCLLPPAWVPIQMSPPAMSPDAAQERQEDENRNLLGADAAAVQKRQHHSVLDADAEAARIGGQEALRQH